MAVDGEDDKSKVAELESFAIAQFKGSQDTNCFLRLITCVKTVDWLSSITAQLGSEQLGL